MPNQHPGSQSLEEGDLFFFHRPRAGGEQVHGLEDIQRLYMIMAPRRAGRRLLRLSMIGRKRLPDGIPGGTDGAASEERNWAMILLTTTSPEEIRQELGAKRYLTATRGERIVPTAKPIGEGRYKLVTHDGHTEIAQILDLSERLGPSQNEFEIKRAASYIVAVRNPLVPQPPGIPAPREQPNYPRHIREKFGRAPWIPVDDPSVLDQPYTQLLLLGARADAVREELGIEIDEARETVTSAESLRVLHLSWRESRLEPLFRGRFPEDELEPARSSGSPK